MKKYIASSVCLVVMAFLFLGCQKVALDTDEVKLKSLSVYSLQDFDLPQTVKYFAIIAYPNRYYGETDLSAIAEYGKKEPLDMEKLKHLSTSKNRLQMYVHGFKGVIDPKVLVAACISGSLPPYRSRVVIYYVTIDGKIVIVNNFSKLNTFIGEVNTPAEIQLYNQLKGQHVAYSYKKTAEAYRLRFDHMITYDSTKRSEHVQYLIMMKCNK